MTRLIALYPRSWRDRYEDEFLALLSDRPPDPFQRLDIARGALDARLHPQVREAPSAPETPEPAPRRAVRAGWITLAGGVVWIAALVVAINGPIVTEGEGTYRDGAAAFPLWFVAVVMLLIGVATVGLSLPSDARTGRVGAYVVYLSGLLWAAAPWLLPVGVILGVGLSAVGVSAWKARRWSGLDAALLVVGQGICWAPLAAMAFGLSPAATSLDQVFLSLAVMTTAWLAVGHALLRGERRNAPIGVETGRP